MTRAEADGGVDDRLTPVLRPVRAGTVSRRHWSRSSRWSGWGLVPGGGRLPAERELAEWLGSAGRRCARC